MQKILIVLFLIATTAHAGKDRGGGDPRAVAFLEYGNQAVSWLLSNQTLDIDIHVNDMKANIYRIEKSLDGLEPVLRFKDQTDISCFNAPKKGCVNEDGTIDIAGKYWETASSQDRCTLAVIELARPQRIELLYSKAGEICKTIYLPESRNSQCLKAANATASALSNYVEALKECLNKHSTTGSITEQFKKILNIQAPQCVKLCTGNVKARCQEVIRVLPSLSEPFPAECR